MVTGMARIEVGVVGGVVGDMASCVASVPVRFPNMEYVTFPYVGEFIKNRNTIYPIAA